MRQFAAVLLLAVVPDLCESQARVIDHAEARRYAGEEVTVEGRVVRVESGGSNTLWLSLGQPHPRSTIVIILPEELAGTIEAPDSLQGAVIRAYGRIMWAGATGGLSQQRGNSPGLQGRQPRTPYLVVMHRRLQVISPADTTDTRPPTPLGGQETEQDENYGLNGGPQSGAGPAVGLPAGLAGAAVAGRLLPGSRSR